MSDEDVKNRPMLSPEGQIKHLKSKGITFNLLSETEAKQYLEENNNYFKLRAYRKSFQKYTVGDNADKYINLDFGMLKDLAIIDMRLRYTLLPFAFDIEHFEKVKLLKLISSSSDDGYHIVDEYLKHLQTKENLSADRKPYSNLMSEINRNIKSEYCGGIINKYKGKYPVWAFVEIIPFGAFIDFLKFCGMYFNNKDLEDDFYLLRDVKRFRNAAAHNNCIIHNLSLNTSIHNPNYKVNRYLANELGISKNVRNKRMSNAAIRDIITLLYTHKAIVKSDGVIKARCKEINEFVDRCFKNIHYYNENLLITVTFDFLKKVVDKMYENVV